MKQQFIVIGSGVIGMTTAISLLEQGHSVHLIAKDFPPNTTSDKAGAIWFPYRVQPIENAISWGKISYMRWKEFSEVSPSGVSMVEFRVVERKAPNSPPWWCDALPHSKYRVQTKDLPAGYDIAYLMEVPFIDPSKCLPFLINYATSLGLTMEQLELQNFELLFEQYPERAIINCTGFGAKALTHDDSLYPVQGQAMAVERFEAPIFQKLDHSPQFPTYMFSRENELIIGGSAIPNNYGEEPSIEMMQQIQQHCVEIMPELASQKVLRQWAGLRPCRPTIRLAWDNSLPVLHNYGHGGAGYTVSWGCANEVLRLLNA